MTGYESKRAAAQDKLAQPALEPNWTCNECGAQEFTAALSEADLDYLACANCGGDEFHKEALAQPALERNFCSRCGKRTWDIHTCTAPQENT